MITFDLQTNIYHMVKTVVLGGSQGGSTDCPQGPCRLVGIHSWPCLSPTSKSDVVSLHATIDPIKELDTFRIPSNKNN